MKNRLKCFKCGKVKDINSKNASKVIECEHCHAKMCIDYETDRKYRYVSMGLIMFIALGLLGSFTVIEKSGNYIPALIALSVALAFTFFSDKLCLLITMKLFGLSYIEYVPMKKKEKKK
ncbi:MAG: hypothetical protein ACI4WM_07055 [Erysipelotrichaceae bacterium]